jgi:hypothetical protein
VLFSAHYVPLATPERLRGSWVAHVVCLSDVSGLGTRDTRPTVGEKCGRYVSSCLLHDPTPCLSVLTVQLSFMQITAHLSGLNYS